LICRPGNVYCLGAWLSLEHPLVLPDLSFLRWAHNRFQAEQRLDILWCSSHQLSSTFTSQLKQHIHFEKVGGQDEGGEAGRWRISDRRRRIADGRCTSAGLHGRLRGAPPAGRLQPRARAAGVPRPLRDPLARRRRRLRRRPLRGLHPPPLPGGSRGGERLQGVEDIRGGRHHQAARR